MFPLNAPAKDETLLRPDCYWFWFSLVAKVARVLLPITQRSNPKPNQMQFNAMYFRCPSENRSKTSRAVFNLLSKVIRVCFGFALICSVIGCQNSRHVLSQWEAKPKSIASCPHGFSRAWHRLHVTTSNSDWFTELSSSLVIGRSNCFAFGLTILNLKTALK